MSIPQRDCSAKGLGQAMPDTFMEQALNLAWLEQSEHRTGGPQGGGGDSGLGHALRRFMFCWSSHVSPNGIIPFIFWE